MRKQTICFVEPSDIIYLIDDNFEIKQLELYPTHLDASLDDRAFISDEVNTISNNLVLKSPEVKDDQLDLFEVFYEESEFIKLLRPAEAQYRSTDAKAFTTEEAAKKFLQENISKSKIMRRLLKETNEEIDIQLKVIKNLLDQFSKRLKKFDIPEETVLASDIYLISELCDLLDIDQGQLLHLNKE